jgi:hypothetical protein
MERGANDTPPLHFSKNFLWIVSRETLLCSVSRETNERSKHKASFREEEAGGWRA